MKITIEARKNTWVPFLDAKAKLKISWRARATYRAHNIRSAHTWPVSSRYTFEGISTKDSIPSSQLIMMEDGVPLAITQTVVSGVKGRLQTEDIEDPFVIITDNLANLSKSDLKRQRVAKGVIERTWTETIVRNLKIENKTGKKVSLKLTISDHPADDLVFEKSEPAPSAKAPPEYSFDIELEPDAERSLSLTFKLSCREKIEIPVQVVQRLPGEPPAPVPNMALEAMDDFPEAVEQVQWNDDDNE